MTEEKTHSSAVPPLDLAGARLMVTVARGDTGAFETLYDGHASRVYGLALHMLRNRQDAEEIAGDVFLTAWRRADSFDVHQGTLVGWLLMMTRRRAIDRLRAQARALAAKLAEAALPSVGLEDLTDEAGVRASSAEVTAVLASLPVAQCRALSLAIVDGYTQAEIAGITGVPLGTVKSRIRLGLARLRETQGPARARPRELVAPW